jgi:hypothetical protein
MRYARLLLAACALFAFGAAADPNEKKPIPDDCPVTLRSEPAFVPLGSDSALEDAFWHGDQRLAVYLNPGARLFVQEQRQKMVWYRERHAGQKVHWTAPLMIAGFRLDSANDEAPYIEGPSISRFEDGFAIMGNIIVFPTRGCWQVSGNYEGDYLSFVVWVD